MKISKYMLDILDDRKCKLICINEDKQELYSTNENLDDGTKCSYDNEDNICVQVSLLDLHRSKSTKCTKMDFHILFNWN